MQPLGRDKKKKTGEEEYSVKKNHSHHFCFSTLHSIIPNLSVGSVVAGTTPVIIHEETALLSKGIGGNCALLTDEIQTSSVMMVTRRRVKIQENYLLSSQQWRRLVPTPTKRNDHHELELLGVWKPPCSSSTHRLGEIKRTHSLVSHGNKTINTRNGTDQK